MLHVACSFYALTPILVPHDQPSDTLFQLLKDAGADTLIAAAGSVPLLELYRKVSTVRQIVWVVEETSQHMDWDAAPAETGGNISVSAWNRLVEQSASATSSELPKHDEAKPPGNIITFWQDGSGGPAQLVEFTQKVANPSDACMHACTHSILRITNVHTEHRLSCRRYALGTSYAPTTERL